MLSSQSAVFTVALSTTIWIAVVAMALTSPLTGVRGALAVERVASLGAPRPGDAIPVSVKIIGVDGESRPRPYGIVIYEGRYVALVEASTRKVVEIVSDDAR